MSSNITKEILKKNIKEHFDTFTNFIEHNVAVESDTDRKTQIENILVSEMVSSLASINSVVNNEKEKDAQGNYVIDGLTQEEKHYIIHEVIPTEIIEKIDRLGNP